MPELTQIQKARLAKKEKHVLIKFSFSEFHRAKSKANQYTNGNLSEWLRYASTLDPRNEDIAAKPDEDKANDE